MNKVYSGAIHVTTQEKPELPSELGKCRFYLQVAGNEIAHLNGTAHQHCRDKYWGKGMEMSEGCVQLLLVCIWFHGVIAVCL